MHRIFKINSNKKHIDELEARMIHYNNATQSAIDRLRVTDTSQPVNIVYPPSQQTFTPLYKDYDPIDPTFIQTEPLKKPKKFTIIHTAMEDIETEPERNLFEHLAEPKIIKKEKIETKKMEEPSVVELIREHGKTLKGNKSYEIKQEEGNKEEKPLEMFKELLPGSEPKTEPKKKPGRKKNKF